MSSSRALLYLLGTGTRNRIRRQVARLRHPRYAVAVVVGLGYVLFFAFQNRSSRSSPDPLALEFAPLFLSLGVVAMLVWSWLFSRERSALKFSLAEVQFLFPAPISRRTLLHYKLAGTQLVVLLNVAIWVVLLGVRPGLPVVMRAVAVWSLLTTLYLHRLGATFVRTSLREHQAHGARRRAVTIGVLLAVTVLLSAAVVSVVVGLVQSPPGGELDAFRATLAQPLVQAALAPFRAVIGPMVATDAAAWWTAAPPALVVLLLHYLWVMRSDTAFEEAAAAASVEQASWLRSGRPGGRRAGRQRYTRPMLQLSPSGPPSTALVWKNVTQLLRWGNFRVWATAFVSAVAVMLVLGSIAPTLAEAAGVLLVSWAAFLLLLGAQWIRNDLRSDLAKLDLLRGYPVASDALVRAEAAGAALVLTLGQAALLLVGMAGLWQDPSVDRAWLGVGAIAGAIVLPALNFAGMMVQNGAALLFPGWVRVTATRGIEALGQHMLTAIAYFFALAVLLLLPAGLGTGVAWLARGMGDMLAVLAGSAVASLVLLGESWLMSLWLGSVFTRTDLASAGVALD
jgi:hypothetical protein